MQEFCVKQGHDFTSLTGVTTALVRGFIDVCLPGGTVTALVEPYAVHSSQPFDILTANQYEPSWFSPFPDAVGYSSDSRALQSVAAKAH
jgi:hypothetical protein